MKILYALGKHQAMVSVTALGLSGHYFEFRGVHSLDKRTSVHLFCDKKFKATTVTTL